MRNFWSFIKWLLKKWFVSNNSWYRRYEREVVSEPVIMIAGTFIVYGVFWVLSLIPLAVINPDFDTIYITWTVMAVVVFGNYFRILLAAQYQQFKKERQQLFEKIKHS
jgi:hypothetical protein